MTFQPTHKSPAAGLEAYADHDAAAGSVARLEPNLPVQVGERWGEWARITCSNGWQAWVDARHLVAMAAAAPAGPPASSTAAPVAAARPTGGLAIPDVELSLAMIGALLVGLAGFVPWTRGDQGPFPNGVDIAITALFGARQEELFPTFSVGLLLVVLAVAGVLALTTFRSDPRVRMVAGYGAVAVALLYGFQLMGDISDANKVAAAGQKLSLAGTLGLGWALAVVSGLLVALGPTDRLNKPKA